MDGNRYIDACYIQRRDAINLIEEFSDELSTMHGTYIDIGCGPGNITHDIILPNLPNDAVIVGVDCENNMIEKAREINQHPERLSFFNLNIETDDLPITEIERYDNAISFYCLHWCSNMRLVFENIYKLLRPGGHALIMFLSYNSGFDAYENLQNDPRFSLYTKDTMRYIPVLQKSPNRRATMKKILEDVGFDVIHCSSREKSFIFENNEIFKNHMAAVSPFLHKIPDDLKDEYINEISKEAARLKIEFKSHNNKSQGYSILDIYEVLITYIRKPDDNSSLMIGR